MAKKDESGRIVIPENILIESTLFIATDKFKPYFFLDNCGRVGININVGCDYPEDIEFLGYCDFDKKTNSILLPDNVDCALGGSYVGEYFFSLKYFHPKTAIPRIYIHKVKSVDDDFSEKFSSLCSNIGNLLDKIEPYINEDIED